MSAQRRAPACGATLAQPGANCRASRSRSQATVGSRSGRVAAPAASSFRVAMSAAIAHLEAPHVRHRSDKARKREFAALRSGEGADFRPFSRFVNGDLAATVSAVRPRPPPKTPVAAAVPSRRSCRRRRGRGWPAMTAASRRRHRRDRGAVTQARDPYRVLRPAVISFSGVRTLGHVLKHVVDAYDGRLPDDISVAFASTGMEHPETLGFMNTCGRAWGMDIVWVEHDWDSPRRTRVVDYATASRDGRPHEHLVGRRIYRRKTGILH